MNTAQIADKLNILTGYSMVEKLKADVAHADREVSHLKATLNDARAKYESAQSTHIDIHRKINDMLHKRSSWTPDDANTFGALHGQELLLEKRVEDSKLDYDKVSDELEAAQTRLLQNIRERYNQEQVWSDKIRSVSTWWTWILVTVQFFSFIAMYAIIEPMKRQKLAGEVEAAFERRLQESLVKLEETLAHQPKAGNLASEHSAGARQAGISGLEAKLDNLTARLDDFMDSIEDNLQLGSPVVQGTLSPQSALSKSPWWSKDIQSIVLTSVAVSLATAVVVHILKPT